MGTSSCAKTKAAVAEGARSLPGYLSQHEEPSAGWAQHAPSLSCGVSLGVQQTELSCLGAQHEDAGAGVTAFTF